MFVARIMNGEESPIVGETGLEPQLWAAIAKAMIAEVRDGATEDQARGFFAALGKRIAALQPVDDIENLDTLCERANRLWTQLGWGHVAMSVDDGGIDLRHEGVPHMPLDDDDDQWLSAAGAMLEGAYDCWFRCLGSTAKLHTRVVRQTGGDFDMRHAL